MEELCIKCKGKGFCGKPCKILARFKEKMPKPSMHFSGSSPPEIFVGRSGYPNVYSGILSPTIKGNTEDLSLPEKWVENNLSIEQVLEKRAQLVYGRNEGNVKNPKAFQKIMQEVALASKPLSTEFFLKKLPRLEFTANKIFTITANPAPVDRVIIEENPKIEKKVDYLTSDYDVKASTALEELYKSKIMITNLQKILSAGLLGVKIQRKLVPTRWAITAVDDTLSKNLLKKIKYYPEISEIQLFHEEYNGNHYEFLLLPGSFSFEVIEAWNIDSGIVFSQDYEGFFGRKSYANSVTGAYYANLLGVAEYLERIKKQAQIIVLREIKQEYFAPLGVGILRETTRKSFLKQPEKPKTIEEAFSLIQKRMNLNINQIKEKSWILENYGKQKSIKNWLNEKNNTSILP